MAGKWLRHRAFIANCSFYIRRISWSPLERPFLLAGYRWNRATSDKGGPSIKAHRWFTSRMRNDDKNNAAINCRGYMDRRGLFAVYHFERIRKFACRAPRSRRKYRDRGIGRRVARWTASSRDVGRPVVIYHALTLSFIVATHKSRRRLRTHTKCTLTCETRVFQDKREHNTVPVPGLLQLLVQSEHVRRLAGEGRTSG